MRGRGSALSVRFSTFRPVRVCTILHLILYDFTHCRLRCLLYCIQYGLYLLYFVHYPPYCIWVQYTLSVWMGLIVHFGYYKIVRNCLIFNILEAREHRRTRRNTSPSPKNPSRYARFLQNVRSFGDFVAQL